MDLTVNQIVGFTKTFLLKKYDDPTPVPEFHKKMWEACLSDSRVAICAPRHHAKSTAITHAYLLASVLFRRSKYALLVSDTEGQASNFLMDIKTELESNIPLREVFGIKRFVKNAVTDVIVEMHDGWKFRIEALGSEGKVRGRKWGNSRPDLIIGDDLENDELVENQDRREKFRNWFFKALVPSLSKNGRVVIVGTILHLDALLYRLMQNKSWKRLFFKAHKSFDDFSEILWPERWPEKALREFRDEKINAGMPEVYSQEYLNNPLDQSEAYFKKEDFLPMEEEHIAMKKNYYAGIDFAISDSDKAAYTAIAVVGVDSSNNIHLVHVVRFRGDSDEIIRNMLAVQQRFDILVWAAEEGQISKAIGPSLYKAMSENNVHLNIDKQVPTKDKRARARSIQARMRAGSCYFFKQAAWYGTFEEELLQFPKGPYKDQVDAFAWVGMLVNSMAQPLTRDEELEEEYEEHRYMASGSTRNPITGY